MRSRTGKYMFPLVNRPHIRAQYANDKNQTTSCGHFDYVKVAFYSHDTKANMGTNLKRKRWRHKVSGRYQTSPTKWRFRGRSFRCM